MIILLVIIIIIIINIRISPMSRPAMANWRPAA
jgi:hypothetical protein